MSYCRLGPVSDCYVYTTGSPGSASGATLVIGADEPQRWCCVACLLQGARHGRGVDLALEPATDTDTAGAMLAHLREHVAAGHRVPADALSRLAREVGEAA